MSALQSLFLTPEHPQVAVNYFRNGVLSFGIAISVFNVALKFFQQKMDPCQVAFLAGVSIIPLASVLRWIGREKYEQMTVQERIYFKSITLLEITKAAFSSTMITLQVCLIAKDLFASFQEKDHAVINLCIYTISFLGALMVHIAAAKFNQDYIRKNGDRQILATYERTMQEMV